MPVSKLPLLVVSKEKSSSERNVYMVDQLNVQKIQNSVPTIRKFVMELLIALMEKMSYSTIAKRIFLLWQQLNA